MKSTVRKKISVTNLTMARTKYIRENYFPLVSNYIRRRRDIPSPESMYPDTMIFEVGVEVLFRAICDAEEIAVEEADQIAIKQYSEQRLFPDELVDRLVNHVELAHEVDRRSSITLEDRTKALEEFRAKRNQEISDEWDEEE
ncbi:MAG: hypothetical protein GX181_10675 [Synergistaceae bacterium]|nr:hypothetical protein [Synergistaceae bacterium]